MMCASTSHKRLFTTISIIALIGLSASSLAHNLQTVSAQGYSECADGIDNDHDGFVDYPQDEGCESLHDTLEGPYGQAVFMTLTDGKEMVEAGGKLVYALNLSTDRHSEQLADIRLLLPHQTNLVSSSDGGSREGQWIVWRNVSVYPGQHLLLTVEVSLDPRAEDGLLVVAEARVNGEIATDTTRVVEHTRPLDFSHIAVTVTDGKVFALPDEVLRYRVTVHNSGTEE